MKMSDRRMPKNKVEVAYRMTRDTFRELSLNDPLRMAGATAFFTTFALPPILMIIVRVLGLFFNRRLIGRRLLQNIEGIIGTEGSEQLRSTIRAVLALQDNWVATAGIFVFLLFVATTVFKVIKSSLNQIWNIRITEKRSLKLRLRSRLHALVVILGAGILFLAVIVIDSIQTILGNYLADILPSIAVYVSSVFNHIVSIIVVTLWFLILFMYLPDGRPRWTTGLAGAFLTSMLFNFGKLILRWALTGGEIEGIYGASGALVLVLLFVFYSSFMLYFGACFIKVLARYRKQSIRPLPHAVKYQLMPVAMKEDDHNK